MDIVVTTPKDRMEDAAREAENVKADGGGWYFRRFRYNAYPRSLIPGDRVYYVEDEQGRGPVIVCRRPWPPMVRITEVEICPKGRELRKETNHESKCIGDTFQVG